MAKVKVARALVRYKVAGKGADDRKYTVTAFYGQVVDIPKAEAERLLAAGEVIDPETALDRPGKMMALPSTASDAEVRAWVAVANESDLVTLKEQRPDIADRIDDAVAYVKANDGTSGTKPNPGEVPPTPDAAITTDPDVPPTQDPAAVVTEDDLIGGAEAQTYDPENDGFDKVVSGNVGAVEDYLKEYPADVNEVLAAEHRRAVAEQKDPRAGVVEAARIAAEHATGA